MLCYQKMFSCAIYWSSACEECCVSLKSLKNLNIPDDGLCNSECRLYGNYKLTCNK